MMDYDDEEGVYGLGTGCLVHGDEYMQECTNCGMEYCTKCFRGPVCQECAAEIEADIEGEEDPDFDDVEDLDGLIGEDKEVEKLIAEDVEIPPEDLVDEDGVAPISDDEDEEPGEENRLTAASASGKHDKTIVKSAPKDGGMTAPPKSGAAKPAPKSPPAKSSAKIAAKPAPKSPPAKAPAKPAAKSAAKSAPAKAPAKSAAKPAAKSAPAKAPAKPAAKPAAKSAPAKAPAKPAAKSPPSKAPAKPAAKPASKSATAKKK